MTFSTSSLCTLSTVVCMYLSGNEIRAEATPPVEYAKASVSVPVARDAAALWNGILFLFAVSIIKFRRGEEMIIV